MCPYIIIANEFYLPTYGLCFGLGFAITLTLTCLIAKKEGNAWQQVLYCNFYALIGIGIGAKLMAVVSKIPGFIRGWDNFVYLWNNDFWGLMEYAFGGLVFYGGLLGAIFGYWVYSKQFKIHINFILDNTVAYFPLLHAFGRLGCLLAGCCYGMEYYGPFAMQFPENELDETLNDVPRFPTQLTEIVFNLILFTVLFILRKKRVLMPKALLGLYLICYAVMRFLLEFVRGDTIRGSAWMFTTSQWVSIILLPVGILLIWFNRKSRLKSKQENLKEDAE